MRIGFFSICLIFLLFACDSTRDYGDKQIFRYNLAEGLTSLDPAFARSLENVSTVGHLFNGLVQMDQQLQLRPCIAKSWQILDSGRVYRFNLRSDVYFHEHPNWQTREARRVKASDFVFSLNRLVDPELLSPGSWVMNPVARLENGELAITAPDDTTVEIKLKESFPPFLGLLSMAYCSVVPEEIVKLDPQSFRSKPIGTGPFQFKFWKENIKLVLLKNPDYFETSVEGKQLPFLDAVSISFTKDEEVNFLKFLKGELDYLSGLKGSYKDELLDSRGSLQATYQAQFKLLKSPYLNTEYLGFYQELEEGNPLLIKDLRKAINYGFDRSKMLQYLRNGIGTPAESGFIPKGLPSYDSSYRAYSFQPDSVQHLLKKAGFPKGEGLPTLKLSTTSQYLDLCEYLQHQLGSFGIPIEIEVNQAAINNEMIAFGKLSFFRKSWVADYPDAENYLSLFYSKNFAPEGPNYTHFKSEVYDSLYLEAMKIDEQAERIKLYRAMNQIITEEAPVVPLFYDEVVRFIPKELSGIGVNPLNVLVLKYAKKKL
jgi:peptide/nickel transport system substrate-binding protein